MGCKYAIILQRNQIFIRKFNPKPMIEVFNLDGMPVYKYRSDENKSFEISELESKGLPCGVYFVKIRTKRGIETSKLLIC